ncbi:Lysophospholipase, alpha-beta hydrolase superfamily [Georgenia satyanarayanai]|uniref:Lysophospholipase, alpha-beta hydrolase superfamily n=1 Tax=Georgenia satyanarayanai TaxID=860221 RepID=A0A2Y9A3D5_9MICO|nr:alpha/beta hydrolase [Georgenia satyanarayanai]PYG01894.1 alpha-beta hydrolase superfamily lysophospholipase [Georgenia satyanarayanai]SSA36697.1 Lysophospholipase, alpha-beta hydrolase superfamily [Georgenia satyanarayanai]
MDTWTYEGHAGELAARRWPVDQPRYVAVLCHGYGEHIGRYEWVAQTLNGHGASVYGVDHAGHGRSAGEGVLIRDFDDVVADLHLLVQAAEEENPGLPVVLVGHSMGGMIAARYVQLHGEELTAVVLSGPVIGRWATVDSLLAMEEIPSTPIDPATLSRDPAVGAAYAEDPLVWHGDFKRPTLEALQEAMRRIAAGGSFGQLPVLYLHGEDDQLVPIGASQAGISAVRGARTEAKVYPGARHEIFNETNKDEVLADVREFIDGVLGV